MPSYSVHSQERLLTCDHKLQRLFNELIKQVDHSILCGYRGKDEQDLAYATKRSQFKWPESRHNLRPSQAVDVQPCPLAHDEMRQVQAFREFGVVVKECASRLGIRVRWGGDFHSWKDYPHWELTE